MRAEGTFFSFSEDDDDDDDDEDDEEKDDEEEATVVPAVGSTGLVVVCCPDRSASQPAQADHETFSRNKPSPSPDAVDSSADALRPRSCVELLDGPKAVLAVAVAATVFDRKVRLLLDMRSSRFATAMPRLFSSCGLPRSHIRGTISSTHWWWRGVIIGVALFPSPSTWLQSL